VTDHYMPPPEPHHPDPPPVVPMVDPHPPPVEHHDPAAGQPPTPEHHGYDPAGAAGGFDAASQFANQQFYDQQFYVDPAGYQSPDPPDHFPAPDPPGGYFAPDPPDPYHAPEPPGGFADPGPSDLYQMPDPAEGYQAPDPPGYVPPDPPGYVGPDLLGYVAPDPPGYPAPDPPGGPFGGDGPGGYVAPDPPEPVFAADARAASGPGDVREAAGHKDGEAGPLLGFAVGENLVADAGQGAGPPQDLSAYRAYAQDPAYGPMRSDAFNPGYHYEPSADGKGSDIYIGDEKIGSVGWPPEKMREWESTFGHDAVRITFETPQGGEEGMKDGNQLYITVLVPPGVPVSMDPNVPWMIPSTQVVPPPPEHPPAHHPPAHQHGPHPHPAGRPEAPAGTPTATAGEHTVKR
jgi:hypothetical protein